MKKYLLLLGFAGGICIGAQAQDYAPFKPGRTPYFQSGDSIYSLRITNAYVQGSDSVFEFNPRAVPVSNPTTIVNCNGDTGTTYADGIRTFNNLFGHKMLKNANNEYRFIFITADTFLLKPQAAVGTSWIFSQPLQLTATVQSKASGYVHGLADSVTTISLSNGETIQLSREYGLINSRSFYSYLSAASLAQPLSLFRLPEAGIGEAVHPYRIYNFQVSDKFLYYGFQNLSTWTCSEYWRTEEILGRSDHPSGDSVTYTIRYQSLYKSYGSPSHPCGTNSGITLTPYTTGTFTVKASDYAFLSHLSREHIDPNSSATYYPPLNTGHYISQVNNTMATTFIDLNYDTCNATYNQTIDHYAFDEYAEGLGLIKHRTYSFSEGGYDLIAYIKGTETYGNWQPLVLANEEDLPLQTLQVYPNPFTSEITIQLSEGSSEPAEITVFNLQGQRVYAQKLSELPAQTGQKVALPQLPTGLYLVQVQQGNKLHSAKVQKQ